ncbi:MAG: hypothetical protein QXJ74_10820 [Nitrososphaera sp.]|uniref:hypothetical protein n=1 Tax=Nitrososphaera sp. TaxID=1971748 RepID=UPI0017BAB35B|nr:hypothetical protein [Nitrososphaera sp.]NWG36196.1 hypothetical protein [Nitrososphaera sp.]
MKGFHDELSQKTYREMPSSLQAAGKVMLHIERFEVGQSYVTAKVEDRNGDKVSINIEGGLTGIDLQENLFRLQGRTPKFAYVTATINETGKLLVRKLPVLGVKDWLLIYEDDLFLLAVKDAYDEVEIVAV